VPYAGTSEGCGKNPWLVFTGLESRKPKRKVRIMYIRERVETLREVSSFARLYDGQYLVCEGLFVDRTESTTESSELQLDFLPSSRRKKPCHTNKQASEP